MQVWPGPVHFPDFISREGQRWWLDQVRAFYADVPFDGLWVDMNEPSNFCTGHVCELPPAGLLDFVDHSASLLLHPLMGDHFEVVWHMQYHAAQATSPSSPLGRSRRRASCSAGAWSPT